MGKVTKFTVEKIPKSAVSEKCKISLKDKYDDGVMDLSMCDLQTVPVNDILTYPKTYSLDLSSNHISALPTAFTSLTNIVKLDLSKNEIQELPSSFGDLSKLKHLDLYRNKLQHLPLSFSNLKNLKWLDLKDNPLVPKVAEVAGPCLNNKQCQSCAKDIVSFFIRLEVQIEEERKMRNKQKQNVNVQIEKKRDIKNKEKTVREEKVPEYEDIPKNTQVLEENIPKKKVTMKRCLMNWFLFWLSLSLVLVFILSTIESPHGKYFKSIVQDGWSHCVKFLPEHLQPAASWCETKVSEMHAFVGSWLANTVQLIREYK